MRIIVEGDFNTETGEEEAGHVEIRSLLTTKDLEKGIQALRKLNLWYLEQIVTRQSNIMLTYQQIKRVHGIEMKEKCLNSSKN
ncbi:15607_t:CDS:2 [Gigaspora rosea]|nr:15607_t:CDS:2 [Gigaspora rosea]